MLADCTIIVVRTFWVDLPNGRLNTASGHTARQICDGEFSNSMSTRRPWGHTATTMTLVFSLLPVVRSFAPLLSLSSSCVRSTTFLPRTAAAICKARGRNGPALWPTRMEIAVDVTSGTYQHGGFECAFVKKAATKGRCVCVHVYSCMCVYNMYTCVKIFIYIHTYM